MCDKNQERSTRAYYTLLAYQQCTGETGQIGEDTFTDLLTDLRHLAGDYAVDFDDAVRVSGNHFEAETSGE